MNTAVVVIPFSLSKHYLMFQILQLIVESTKSLGTKLAMIHYKLSLKKIIIEILHILKFFDNAVFKISHSADLKQKI